MRLANKNALITGGSSGIGLATARLFMAQGARVAITGRNRKKLDSAAESLGTSVLAIQVDVTDVPAMEQVIANVVKTFGTLDIVFANAGVGAPTPVGQTAVSAFEEIVRINLIGVFFTIQAAAAHLNDGASIILNGSAQAVMGAPRYSAYAASKAGVRSMTRNLASELAPRGIRVNQVTPGGTSTPIWLPIAPTAEAMMVLEKRIALTAPLARLAAPDEIAKAVLYLASDDSSFMTGAEVVVDGGATGAPLGAPAFRVATPPTE
jgi:NAD(P)-dependent dehydrogenase (short-subunit alcohol dehydrogenase family)